MDSITKFCLFEYCRRTDWQKKIIVIIFSRKFANNTGDSIRPDAGKACGPVHGQGDAVEARPCRNHGGQSVRAVGRAGREREGLAEQAATGDEARAAQEIRADLQENRPGNKTRRSGLSFLPSVLYTLSARFLP